MASLLLVVIYLAFISLGLPDSLLGSAWPVMHPQMSVPVSFAGFVGMVSFVGTVISSLFSDKLLRKFGAGKTTAVSVALTAIALFGYSVSTEYWMLLLWAVPYGIGAGGVDAILNNYVALNFKAQHMSWLHCMWGVGASISPYIMSFSLAKLENWNYGYLIVSIIQAVLSVIIFISIPIWKKGSDKEEKKEEKTQAKPLPFKEIFKTKGAIACFLTFFCYCALELTTSLWASTYLVERWQITPEIAAGFASMFYIGITLGRLINGFFAIKFSDKFLIRTGFIIIAVGTGLMFIPWHSAFALVGLVIAGFGCAPIYPCIIHMTPTIFGREKSQSMIGVQMAFAYTGFLTMPPLFGVFADYGMVYLLPVFMIVLLALMALLHEVAIKRAKQ